MTDAAEQGVFVADPAGRGFVHVHARATLEFQSDFRPVRGHGLNRGFAGAHGAQGVVRVGFDESESSQNRVTLELHDVTAEGFDLSRQHGQDSPMRSKYSSD